MALCPQFLPFPWHPAPCSSSVARFVLGGLSKSTQQRLYILFVVVCQRHVAGQSLLIRNNWIFVLAQTVERRRGKVIGRLWALQGNGDQQRKGHESKLLVSDIQNQFPLTSLVLRLLKYWRRIKQLQPITTRRKTNKPVQTHALPTLVS